MVGSLDDGSGFRGRGLDYSYGARGVLKSAEGTSQKFSEFPYTNRQINQQLKRIDRIAQGKIRISDLESEIEKVAEFLENLKH